MKKTILSLGLATLLSSGAFASEYVVEAKSVVIEGQAAIDLYDSLNDKTVEYTGYNQAIKSKNNVTCVAEILAARGDGEFVADAKCTIRLSNSTVISE